MIPFYEEVCFRGYAFGALERRWGAQWALVVSSLAFALVHGLDYAPVMLFVGLSLGWLRLRTGDLRQCVLLHCLNNSFGIVALCWLKH